MISSGDLTSFEVHQVGATKFCEGMRPPAHANPPKATMTEESAAGPQRASRVTGKGNQPCSRPTKRVYDMVQSFLQNDPATRDWVGARTEPIQTREGEEILYSIATVQIAEALHREGIREPKQAEVVRLAHEMMASLGNAAEAATKPSSPTSARPPEREDTRPVVQKPGHEKSSTSKSEKTTSLSSNALNPPITGTPEQTKTRHVTAAPALDNQAPSIQTDTGIVAATSSSSVSRPHADQPAPASSAQGVSEQSSAGKRQMPGRAPGATERNRPHQPETPNAEPGRPEVGTGSKEKGDDRRDCVDPGKEKRTRKDTEHSVGAVAPPPPTGPGSPLAANEKSALTNPVSTTGQGVPALVSANAGGTEAANDAELVDQSSAYFWSDRINPYLTRGAECWVNAGKNLIAAKMALDHGEWLKLIPLLKIRGDERMAQMLMAIARNSALANPNNYSHLPVACKALSELSKTEPERLQKLIDEGQVSPGLSIKHAKALASGETITDLDRCEGGAPVFDLESQMRKIEQRILHLAQTWPRVHRKDLKELLLRMASHVMNDVA